MASLPASCWRRPAVPAQHARHGLPRSIGDRKHDDGLGHHRGAGPLTGPGAGGALSTPTRCSVDNAAMNIQLLSALHLEANPDFAATPAAGADVLVLAGDIGSYQTRRDGSVMSE